MKYSCLFFSVILNCYITAQNIEYSLIKEINIGPYSSGQIKSAELNGDNIPDIAYLTTHKITGEIAINIRFGANNANNSFLNIYKKSIGFINPHYQGPVGFNLRNQSSEILVLKDYNNDQRVDLLTSYGVLKNTANGFEFFTFQTHNDHAFPLPVAFYDKKLYRAQRNGTISICDTSLFCSTIASSNHNYLDSSNYIINDMNVEDFNNDGLAEIIYGYNGLPYQSFFLDSIELMRKRMLNASNADYESHDINNDGYVDLFAQVTEYISDFPSYTDIYLGSDTGLYFSQRLTNCDNHNETAFLSDIDLNQKIDYLTTGVDVGTHILNYYLDSSDSECILIDTNDFWSGISIGYNVSAYNLLADSCLEIVVSDGFFSAENSLKFFSKSEIPLTYFSNILPSKNISITTTKKAIIFSKPLSDIYHYSIFHLNGKIQEKGQTSHNGIQFKTPFNGSRILRLEQDGFQSYFTKQFYRP